VSIWNLETQVGQLAKQISEQQGSQFFANTQANPKEYCKAISTRSGKVVGAGIGDNLRTKKATVEERIDESEASEQHTEKTKSGKQNPNLEEEAAQPMVKEKE